MGMLESVAARVAAGETVTFRPSGGSMVPLIFSRQQVVVAPADPSRLAAGDIVLARVAGTTYLHLVSAVDPARRRVRISNNRGRVNGWTGWDRVFGICVAVEGSPRPGVDGKIRTSARAAADGTDAAAVESAAAPSQAAPPQALPPPQAPSPPRSASA